MGKRNCVIAMLASLILLFAGFATASTVINYQGLLTDASSNPVPDDTYQIIFSIWDAPTLGNQLWTEPHPAVQTTNGHFSVELGSIDPINLDDLGSAALYLQMQVETEPPMDPRIQLNWVPYGAVSQRVLGDVVTDEGSLTIQLPESEQLPYINMNVDSAQANVMLSPGYPDGPGINMVLTETLEGMGAELTLRGENGSTNVGMGAGPGDSFFDVMYTIPLAVDMRGVEILADSSDASVSIKRELPDAEPPFTLFEASANDAMTQLNMRGLSLMDGPAVNMQVTLTTEAYDAGMAFIGAEGGPTLKAGADPDSAGIIIIGGTPTDGNKSINLQANTGEAGIIVIDSQPTGEEKSINIGTSTDEAGIIVIDSKPTGEVKTVNLETSTDNAGIIIIDSKPTGEEKSINLETDISTAGIIVIDSQPTGEEKSVNIGTSTDNAGIIVIDSKPTGDSAIVEMTANNGADLTINFTQPLDNQAHGVGLAANSGLADVNVYFAEPLDEGRHGVQIFSDSTGGNINVYQELAEGEEIGTPMFSVSGSPDTGVSARIFNPLLEPPGRDPMIEMRTAPGNNASFVMFQPQPEPPGNLHEAIMMETSYNGSRALGASVKMFQPQPEPPGIPAAIQMAAQTNNTFFDVFKYTQDPMGGMDSSGMHMTADSSEISMELLQGANTWVKLFANEDGGGIKFFDDGSEYMGVEPSPFYNAGDMKMYDSTQATSIIVSSLGMVSIGTGVMGNILTIARGASTFPIADAWTLYSSRRWKRKIEPIEGSLDKVMNLRGVSFEWKDSGKEDIGLIAEEVAEVVPQVVAYEENGEDAQSVDYARLVALLIEATKEQQKEIEELKAEVDELRDRIR
ncbi:MAG: tail fiber domain-containing protein [Candidatus Zixiibacteriota bacterium]|nr:MAG: tail fiber domain-containing protein [candidate division Zixibacteria bacterium]